MKRYLTGVLSLSVVIFMSSCGKGGASAGSATIESRMDSVNYGLGIDIAQNVTSQIKEMMDKPDYSLIQKGFDDYLTDTSSIQISKADVRIMLDTYFQKLAEEQQAAKKKAADENKVIETKSIEDFLAKNNIEVETKENEVRVQIKKRSVSSVVVEPGDEVTVNYTGRLLDGTVFDTSEGKDPFTFTSGFGMVIMGWDEGLNNIPEGTKLRMIIPSWMGYGPDGMGERIPKNATLDFDIEIVKISKAPETPEGEGEEMDLSGFLGEQ